MILKRVTFQVKNFEKTNKFLFLKQKGKMHKGYVLAKHNEYEILDCKICKFIHCTPFPKEKDVNLFYKKIL